MICAFKKLILIALLAVLGSLEAISALTASSLGNINVSNTQRQATILISFYDQPNYGFFFLHGKERMVFDINKQGKIAGLPMKFIGQNLIRNIRSSTPKDNKSIRIVFDLSQRAKMRVVTHQNNGVYILVFSLVAVDGVNTTLIRKATAATVTSLTLRQQRPVQCKKNGTNNFRYIPRMLTHVTKSHVASSSSTRIVVAIDAGHGGQDPGAIGRNGLKEKNITIAIARRLQELLNDNPKFNSVLTRNGDYFISVMGRSDMARKQGANVLVSIHADAAPNSSINGTSVWVLSNRRANNEMANWLEQHEKQSELLGGAGDMLANSQADPYLSQAVLDLQFGHSQRVGYDIAMEVLQNLQYVGSLHKNRPEYASLGVLRSPDIPSLLVETGFITNNTGERLLGSASYQNKIAMAIYNGLSNYFLAHPLQSEKKIENRTLDITAKLKYPTSDIDFYRSIKNLSSTNRCINGKTQSHVIHRCETLSIFADRHRISLTGLHKLKKLNKDSVLSGECLKMPHNKIMPNTGKKNINHTVVKHETLSAIALHYGISVDSIKWINKLKSDVAPLGRMLTIPKG